MRRWEGSLAPSPSVCSRWEGKGGRKQGDSRREKRELLLRRPVTSALQNIGLFRTYRGGDVPINLRGGEILHELGLGAIRDGTLRVFWGLYPFVKYEPAEDVPELEECWRSV